MNYIYIGVILMFIITQMLFSMLYGVILYDDTDMMIGSCKFSVRINEIANKKKKTHFVELFFPAMCA